jgi:flagellar assembly factor FliW
MNEDTGTTASNDVPGLAWDSTAAHAVVSRKKGQSARRRRPTKDAPVQVQESTTMQKIATSRFGTVEVSEENLIRFDSGLIGFPQERMFALIPHGSSTVIAWLQSVSTPELAFPVVSAHGLVADYPDVPVTLAAEKVGLGTDAEQLAILAVLCANQGVPASVNLLAPILIDVATHCGAQVFLDGSRFTTRELFVLPGAPRERKDGPSAGAAPAP